MEVGWHDGLQRVQFEEELSPNPRASIAGVNDACRYFFQFRLLIELLNQPLARAPTAPPLSMLMLIHDLRARYSSKQPDSEGERLTLEK